MEYAKMMGGSGNPYQQISPFQAYQGISNKYQTPYQFSSVGANPLLINEDMGSVNNYGYVQKFGSDPGWHSAVETHSHYGPPAGKSGKLKGAAISALTLLAFLFFLNLLQSCLKDQMDAINPTVRKSSYQF